MAILWSKFCKRIVSSNFKMFRHWHDGFWGKVPAAKPDNLSLVPGTHMVGENQLLTSSPLTST